MVGTKGNKKENKHVVPREGGWGVKTAGGERDSRFFRAKGDAIEYAKELAIKHNVCIVIHGGHAKFEGFDCKPEIRNQHVVKKKGRWAVISEGGKEISKIFGSKGAAMSHAFDIAKKHNVCLIVHGRHGKFKSVTCNPERTPGIL